MKIWLTGWISLLAELPCYPLAFILVPMIIYLLKGDRMDANVIFGHEKSDDEALMCNI